MRAHVERSKLSASAKGTDVQAGLKTSYNSLPDVQPLDTLSAAGPVLGVLKVIVLPGGIQLNSSEWRLHSHQVFCLLNLAASCMASVDFLLWEMSSVAAQINNDMA